jgi:hypothetical protein
MPRLIAGTLQITGADADLHCRYVRAAGAVFQNEKLEIHFLKFASEAMSGPEEKGTGLVFSMLVAPGVPSCAEDRLVENARWGAFPPCPVKVMTTITNDNFRIAIGARTIAHQNSGLWKYECSVPQSFMRLI